ncbi:hypothetical protein [Dactylosporangium sp. NPDC049140]|uniref:hypothetical protein n=1 Tax=Dactylosporangium sp. NPDC049140 TaxID=3155647 RepID=UPI0033CC8AB7
MPRRLILFIVAALLATLAVAAPAHASARSTSLTPGSPVTATVATAGAGVSYTFAGAGGQHVAFDVSASGWGSGSGYLTLYNPSGGQFGYIVLGNGATYGDFTLNSTGTWEVRVSGYAAATGSATFTLAFDVTGGALTAGVAVTQPIGLRGQNANFTFAGTSGQYVTVDVSASNWGTGSAYITLYNPSGGQYAYMLLGNGTANRQFQLNVSGTWTLRLDPYGSATGGATFRLLTP